MKKILLWLLVFGIILMSVNAITITNLEIDPPRTVQGGYFEVTVTTDVEADWVKGNVTFPDGRSIIFDYDQVSTLKWSKTLKNTEQLGLYTLGTRAKAGAEYDEWMDNATVHKISALVDYIQEVEKVKFTEKITNQTKMRVGATEYEPFDAVKVFLQLTEGEQPVNNALCYIDVYYPNNTKWQNNQVMVYLNGSNGLYFWTSIAPNVTGVYMIEVDCHYTYESFWVYEQGELDKYPVRTLISGVFQGGDEINLNDYDDGLYTELYSAIVGAYKVIDVYYDFNVSEIPENVTEAVVYWMGESNGVPLMTMYYWNWTSSGWVQLPNSLTLSGQAGTEPSGIGDILTNLIYTLNNDTIQNDTIRVRLYTKLSAFHSQYNNWLALRFVYPSTETVDEIRGGGELHITAHITEAKNLLQQILDYLQNTIYPFLQNIFDKLIGIETQLNTTINITNQSLILDTEINQTTHLVKNDTSTIISQIEAVNKSMHDKFTEKDEHIQSVYNNLTLQISLLENETGANFDTTWAILQQMEANQNASHQEIINFLTQIDNNINQSTQGLNTSIHQFIEDAKQEIEIEINETQDLIESVNQSLTAQILLNRESIFNLSLQLNETKWQLHNHINAINQSLYLKIDEVEIKTDYVIDYIQNMTLMLNQTSGNVFDFLQSMNQSVMNEFGDIQQNFSSVFNELSNISTQIDTSTTNILTQMSTYHNITQQNISQISTQIDNLNTSIQNRFDYVDTSINALSNKTDYYFDYLNDSLVEIKSEVSNIENMTYEIYNWTWWLVVWHNITTTDLNLVVEAPSKCLAGTNWICKAQVRDRWGKILSPLDNVYCNVTTDLWGEAEMTYEYAEQKWKYIHQCNPAYTTFNWTVRCDWTS